MIEPEGPILHVLLVGFHHKKGCEVEYSYPSLVPEAPNECPLSWKYLPTLALPDGSHNYDEDTVFFHLPSLTDPTCTVYGVSCFKQISVEKLKFRTSDITRGTVQKSVCVLSTLPLYGHIQVKVALITDAYFEEGDFSKVSLLKDTYHHLNSCINKESQIPPQIFGGLSARDFILQFRHKVLLLFKLLLLEKKIIFFQSPVHPLCTTILTLLSLFPGMIECGLKHAAYVRSPRRTSPTSNFKEGVSGIASSWSILNTLEPKAFNREKENVIDEEKEILHTKDDQNLERMEEICEKTLNVSERQNVEKVLKRKIFEGIIKGKSKETQSNEANFTDSIKLKEDFNVITFGADDEDSDFRRHSNIHIPLNTQIVDCILQVDRIDVQKCSLPLCIFSEGYLCLPYLSLPYLELLSDKNVRGYIVGATNVLFKQKKELIDVLIDVESGRIEANDPELRRQLHLTTEDLRFIDYVIKCVVEPKQDTCLNSPSCEGGDEWIRSQFKVYLLHLLRTSLQYDTRETDHFNSSFMLAWRSTNNYKIWKSTVTTEINSIEPGHPFARQLSVQDMKLRLSHSMENTESGRKLNQAMLSTGRAVATTGKAVGGALSQAKDAVSSWWNTLTTLQTSNVAKNDNLPADEKIQNVLRINKGNPN